jgi:hypothetical protein
MLTRLRCSWKYQNFASLLFEQEKDIETCRTFSLLGQSFCRREAPILQKLIRTLKRDIKDLMSLSS